MGLLAEAYIQEDEGPGAACLPRRVLCAVSAHHKQKPRVFKQCAVLPELFHILQRSLSFSVAIMDLLSRWENLASVAVAPFTPPVATLAFPALAEIPDTPLEAMTSVASPAFVSAILEVVPASLRGLLASSEAAVEALAIHQDSPARAATKSSHSITLTLASALAAAVMEESSVWAAVAVVLAAITEGGLFI